jgi:hypothetical protein
MLSAVIRSLPHDIEPGEWLRVPIAEKYSGFKKSFLYELILSGEIKSFSLKANRDSIRGARLISKSSLDAYFSKKAREAGLEVA